MEMNKITEYEEKVKSYFPRISATCQHVLALMIHYSLLSHNFLSWSSSFELPATWLQGVNPICTSLF